MKPEPRSAMRVLSLNLWNLNEPLEKRMHHLDAFLQVTTFDVILLQEVSPTEAGILQTDSIGALADLHRCFQATGEWMGRAEGLAVYSNQPFSSVCCHRLPGRDSDMDRGLLHVTIETEGPRLHVFNTHLAFRVDDADLRAAQAAGVAEKVSVVQCAQPDDLVLLCGDLNDTPGSETVRIIEAAGLRNAFSGAEGEPFTFSSSNPYVNPELLPDRRIDHAFVSSSVVVRSARMVLDDPDSLASDHYGLALEISL